MYEYGVMSSDLTSSVVVQLVLIRYHMPEREIDGPTSEPTKLSISLQNLLQKTILKKLMVV